MTTHIEKTLQTLLPTRLPIALAPMAGVTDLPFRVICRELGADYTVSEMVSAKALLFRNPKTFAMLEVDPPGASGGHPAVRFGAGGIGPGCENRGGTRGGHHRL